MMNVKPDLKPDQQNKHILMVRRAAMFQEFQIAQAKHAELDARFNSAKIAEGMTVEVLTIFDRALLAVQRVARTALANVTDTRGHKQLTVGRVLATSAPTITDQAT